MHNKQLKTLFFVLFLLTFSLTGCQSVATFYQGKYVAEEDVIPLSEAAKNATWETFDLKIKYSYQKKAGFFNIDGQVLLSQHFTMNYAYLQNLDIYLVMIDNNAKVLKTAKLANSYTYDIARPIYFSTQLAVPEAATAFSFAYDGTAKESDGKKGTIHSFWHLPRE